jgi:hypothetical protein
MSQLTDLLFIPKEIQSNQKFKNKYFYSLLHDLPSTLLNGYKDQLGAKTNNQDSCLLL